MFRLQFAVLLLIFLSISVAPIVNADLQNSKLHKVVFISPGHSGHGFWKAVTDTMNAAAEQLGFQLEVHHADRQWVTMVHKAENVIARPDKPDFLILVNEYQQGARLLALAEKADIPTIMLLNSLTPDQRVIYGKPRERLKNWLGSLTPDNKIAGYEMAKSLVRDVNIREKNKPQPIPLLTFAGDNTSPASLYRLQGLDRALNDFPMLKEQRRFSVNWSKDEAYKRTRLWLQSGQKLGAVWAANDAIGLGSIKAIREAGLKPGHDVRVSGLNWSKEAIKHVINGEMTLSHGGHFLAGAWVMVMLYDYVHGHDFKAISTEVHFPMTAMTQANASDYLKHFESQQWSKVNFKEFSLANTPSYQFTLAKLLQSVRQSVHK